MDREQLVKTGEMLLEEAIILVLLEARRGYKMFLTHQEIRERAGIYQGSPQGGIVYELLHRLENQKIVYRNPLVLRDYNQWRLTDKFYNERKAGD